MSMDYNAPHSCGCGRQCGDDLTIAALRAQLAAANESTRALGEALKSTNDECVRRGERLAAAEGERDRLLSVSRKLRDLKAEMSPHAAGVAWDCLDGLLAALADMETH